VLRNKLLSSCFELRCDKLKLELLPFDPEMRIGPLLVAGILRIRNRAACAAALLLPTACTNGFTPEEA